MQNHPLTPMTDPDIRRWLALQTQHSVGHVAAEALFAGAAQIVKSLEDQHRAGHRHIVVDAIRDEDLIEIGRAAADLPLITGGSGVALGLPANFGCAASQPAWVDQPGKSIALLRLLLSSQHGRRWPITPPVIPSGKSPQRTLSKDNLHRATSPNGSWSQKDCHWPTAPPIRKKLRVYRTDMAARCRPKPWKTSLPKSHGWPCRQERAAS